MLILTENTPNPHAIKFLPGVAVAMDQPTFFSSQEQTKLKSILAFKLFNIEDIAAVFFGSDFITITKNSSSDWNVLKPEILMTIMDHLTMNLPIFDCVEQASSAAYDSETMSEIEKQIIEIIDTRVRPSVAMDGGDIVYRGFQNGVVMLELRGSCSGCPSSSMTLKNGIESMLKHFIPEVESVEAIPE